MDYLCICIFIDLLLIHCTQTGKSCAYSYYTDYRLKHAYRYCVTDCCGRVGSFICCIRGSYYKYLQDANRQDKGPLNVEAIAAIVIGSIIGLAVFIGILAALYFEYWKCLFWCRTIKMDREIEIVVDSDETLKDDNEKNERKLLETHFP